MFFVSKSEYPYKCAIPQSNQKVNFIKAEDLCQRVENNLRCVISGVTGFLSSFTEKGT